MVNLESLVVVSLFSVLHMFTECVSLLCLRACRWLVFCACMDYNTIDTFCFCFRFRCLCGASLGPHRGSWPSAQQGSWCVCGGQAWSVWTRQVQRTKREMHVTSLLSSSGNAWAYIAVFAPLWIECCSMHEVQYNKQGMYGVKAFTACTQCMCECTVRKASTLCMWMYVQHAHHACVNVLYVKHPHYACECMYSMHTMLVWMYCMYSMWHACLWDWLPVLYL